MHPSDLVTKSILPSIQGNGQQYKVSLVQEHQGNRCQQSMTTDDQRSQTSGSLVGFDQER